MADAGSSIPYVPFDVGHLAIARWLARNAERRTKWGRQFQVTGLVEEFADVLQGELDFHIEARMAAEASAAMAAHAPIRSVEIVESLTTDPCS